MKEAVAFAREDFGDLLMLLPSAEKSAEESPYNHPDQVDKLFQSIAEIMTKIRVQGSIGTNLFEEFKRYGFE